MTDKPSLFNASSHLAEMINQIDEGADLSQELLEEFNQTRTDIAQAIDRRKYVIAEADARIAAAKKIIDDAKKYIKQAEKVKAKIKETTKDAIALNPEYMFKDTLGRKISIRKTPGKVKYRFEVKSTSISNVIDPLLANDKKVYPYILEKTYYCIDADAVKKDLKGGHCVPFAQLIKDDIVSGLD